MTLLVCLTSRIATGLRQRDELVFPCCGQNGAPHQRLENRQLVGILLQRRGARESGMRSISSTMSTIIIAGWCRRSMRPGKS